MPQVPARCPTASPSDDPSGRELPLGARWNGLSAGSESASQLIVEGRWAAGLVAGGPGQLGEAGGKENGAGRAIWADEHVPARLDSVGWDYRIFR